ncbi:MAG: alpha/beta hydrolase [Gammaproteobacteria bacterium]|jgi:acetyl esterase/lipase|nr:lipase [Gammaproteobacteria bacterium]MDP6097919.1 alpha/beta hydrolase [Gammaproteobacteria bacterium]HJO12132.1 alpha/beta hydrolase [Gammaproteobacteria bacterium]|tara:strand:- start:673 stop:1578 length:906 start_codon:yes stop_codon:yes gene_type:complete
MQRVKLFLFCGLALFSCMAPSTSLAQLSSSAIWAAEIETRYRFQPNVSYHTENGIELKLDIYSRRDVDTPQPTMVFTHGGFWVRGSKDTQLMALLPWLEMGWNVVNVGYRLGGEALAPAALVDTFCALRFINANADEYNIDADRLVTSGQSAGGHLALSAAMLSDAGFDAGCPAGDTPAIAAVINWYGVTDVPDVIDGPNRSEIAAAWFGDMDKGRALELAERLSPLQYVRDDLPPILTVQGDADTVVPYAEGVALHEALKGTNVKNRLLTIPGGGHGRFTAAERVEIYDAVQDFLRQAGL